MNNITQFAFWKHLVTPNGYSYSKIPDLIGKVAIVTGANSGLGFATTVALAAKGAHVFLACRSQQRALDAIIRVKAEVKKAYPCVDVEALKLEFLELDLNDLKKARESARTFVSKGLPLHILVNNSGIMATPFELSADGIETQFAVNHLGHFVFTLELLEKLKESQPSRIVILSSMAHEMAPRGGIAFDKLNDEKALSSMTRYGQSKLANLLFGRALAQRLIKEKVFVNIAHPGYVDSNLANRTGETYGSFTGRMSTVAPKVFGMKPKEGALTQLYLATSSEIEEKDLRGRYFIPIAKEIQPTSYGRNVDLQEKLWTFSDNLVKEKLGS
ncbi:hypothetical protein BG015_004847 [Linnemannia schmuckeri]|uniref:NAD(P)-binding protein n=1 Tax=Linnemannia schmuckeri TaxID=64567 RepID=A0A9P5R9X6_9FUNG|nr:hypothetical protein BG015_004847 [Linnemannia schmuckeri]